ncbi:MAG: glycosyltransferase family 2 protein [Clostridia bacterium]|nr:glycosyltransferase family 2 protein [Clostridia bacterium]
MADLHKVILSIIVPVYNTEKFLRECLDSLLDQVVDKALYEIICVNDGSTDDSLSILCEYEANNQNISVYSTENRGVSSARNIGVKNANGKYIWFVDSDDLIKKNCLKPLISILKNNNYPFFVVDIDYYRGHIDTCEEIGFQAKNDLVVSDFVCGNIFLSEVIKSNNILFDESLKYGEDTLFNYTVWMHLSGGALLNEKLYHYRVHDNSATTQIRHSDEKWCRRIWDAIEKCCRFNEFIKTATPEKAKEIRKRRDIETECVLYLLPACSLEYAEVMHRLKSERLYPYRLQFDGIKNARKKGYSKKSAFLFLLFPIEIYYKLYYRYRKRKR